MCPLKIGSCVHYVSMHFLKLQNLVSLLLQQLHVKEISQIRLNTGFIISFAKLRHKYRLNNLFTFFPHRKEYNSYYSETDRNVLVISDKGAVSGFCRLLIRSPAETQLQWEQRLIHLCTVGQKMEGVKAIRLLTPSKTAMTVTSNGSFRFFGC